MRFFLIFLTFCTLAACNDRSFTPVTPSALDVGKSVTVFAGSTRAQDQNGSFGHRRSEALSLMELTVSIPPSHTPGELDFAYANPDPETQFTLAGQKVFETKEAFGSSLRQTISQSNRRSREATIFVHGYNATQAETAFRAAQMYHDIELPGAMMIYSWPSRGKAFGYAYDIDSALGARDGLEEFIRNVRANGVDRVVLVAHSMGSMLTMEMLRMAEAREPGWAARSLAGIVLLSPDLDIDLFRSQMNDLTKIPQPFLVVVSEKDKALNISGRLRGNNDADRLGNIGSIDAVSDLPISVIDTTDFSSDAASSHLVAATSPTLIAMFKSLREVSSRFGEDDPLAAIIPGSSSTPPTSAREITLTQNESGQASAK